VTADVDIVTLTMGGNDAFLAKKVAGCFLGECGPDVYGVEAGTESVKTTWDDIFDRLVAMYTDIRTRMDRDGHLYVLSYPIPFNGTSDKCEGFTYNEQLAANAFATRIGDTIYLAVQAANNNLAASGRPGHVHFVDWRKGTRVNNLYEVPSGYPDAGSTFPVVVTSNGLCGKKADSFLNGFQSRSWDPANPDRINSFHPNTKGQDFAAEILAKAVLADFVS
jgi:lysophospholipase L1-like esterase